MLCGRGTRQLDRGTRVELPDDRLTSAVRSARAAALLAGTRRAPSGIAVAALEDWGFDAEAADGFTRLTGRERRVARRRPGAVPTWADIETTISRGEPEWLLLALRALLVHEDGDVVSLLGSLPSAWHGQPIAVHDAPTQRGPVSFAVRWHGARPALLWDVPAGTTVRAPALDPEWESTEPSGEALLPEVAAPPAVGDAQRRDLPRPELDRALEGCARPPHQVDDPARRRVATDFHQDVRRRGRCVDDPHAEVARFASDGRHPGALDAQRAPDGARLAPVTPPARTRSSGTRKLVGRGVEVGRLPVAVVGEDRVLGHLAALDLWALERIERSGGVRAQGRLGARQVAGGSQQGEGELGAVTHHLVLEQSVVEQREPDGPASGRGAGAVDEPARHEGRERRPRADRLRR